MGGCSLWYWNFQCTLVVLDLNGLASVGLVPSFALVLVKFVCLLSVKMLKKLRKQLKY